MAQQRRPVSRTAQTTTPKQQSRGSRTLRKPSTGRPFDMPFESKNIIIILAGLVIIALGYFLMASDEVMGSMALTVAPILLVIGYLIVIPYGIMFGAKMGRKKTPDAEQPAAQES